MDGWVWPVDGWVWHSVFGVIHMSIVHSVEVFVSPCWREHMYALHSCSTAHSASISEMEEGVGGGGGGQVAVCMETLVLPTEHALPWAVDTDRQRAHGLLVSCTQQLLFWLISSDRHIEKPLEQTRCVVQ